jgi:hypothetical protein
VLVTFHGQHFVDFKGVASSSDSPKGDTVDNFGAVGFHKDQQASTILFFKLLNLRGLQCDVYHSTPAPKAGVTVDPESSVFNYLRFNDLRAVC